MKYILISFFFFLASCKKIELNTSYFIDAYKIRSIEDKDQITIENEFIHPFYIKTSFIFKNKSNFLNEILNTIDENMFGENFKFYSSIDRLLSYKYNNINNTYSYALFFDDKGNMVLKQGSIRVDKIPQRDSTKLYGIEVFFSKFYYDDVIIKMKNDKQDNFIVVQPTPVKYSPFIISVYIDLRNKKSDRGRIYFEYELQSGLSKFYEYDTLNYNYTEVW